jgi:predicted SAM-dependent methyltransferase
VNHAQREKLLRGLNVSQLVGVEIGALDKPFVRRSDGEIIYVDYANRETLIEKYKDDDHVDVNQIVDVDAIWGGNTLADAIGQRKVDYVIASHVIEHVPDLITWLGELRAILKDTGEVRLIVPDRRFTFDYLRKETRLSDVMNAFLVKARVPQPHAVLDFHLNAARIDCARAWEGRLELADIQRYNTFRDAVDAALDVLEHGTYRDVHCWVFTPKSFADLFSRLASEGLLDFACEEFEDTEKYQFEFFVTLRSSTDGDHIAESWRRMNESAREYECEAAILEGDDLAMPTNKIKAANQLVISASTVPPKEGFKDNDLSDMESAATSEDVSREVTIRALFDTSGHGLEIGPSYNPIMPKRGGFHVEIVDHASMAELRTKYANEPNVDISRIEEVDYIWDGRPLSEVVGARNHYDYVVASHVIEHTPDMLSFLVECDTMLKPTGTLVLAVPDKRRCFDMYRPLSTTGSVLQAHLEKRTRHLPGTAFDHVAYFATLNGPSDRAEGPKGEAGLEHALSFATAVFDRSVTSRDYFDFHAWVFTPSSFRMILRDLTEIGSLHLREVNFQTTPIHEFYITLSRSGSGCPHDRASLLIRTRQELGEYPAIG